MFSYRSLVFTLSILLLAGALYWRSTASTVRADGEEAPVAKADDKAPAPPKDIDQMIDEVPLAALEDGVVMQSGDIKVPLSEVEKAESGFIASKKKQDPKFELKPEFQSYMRKHFAFRFLANLLVEKYAHDNKIEVPQDKFEKSFAEFQKEQEAHGVAYQEWLANTGMTDAEFRKFWGLNWALEQQALAKVSEADVDKRYDAVKGQLDQAPLRRASHILFMYKGGQGAERSGATRTKEEAKAAAEDALKKLKDGADFAQLAKQCSDCPSKAQGGDLGFFPRTGAMVEPFAAATYKLAKVGDITDVVETPFGFHVIKLTEIRDVKDQLRKQLSSEKFSQQMQQLLEAGLAGAKFNEKLLPKAPPHEEPMKMEAVHEKVPEAKPEEKAPEAKPEEKAPEAQEPDGM